MKRATFVLLVVLALPGCLNGLLPKAQDRAVFGFSESGTLIAKHPLSAAVLVETPHALAPLDSDDVVVMRGNGEIQVMPGVRWAAAVPILLQDLLARQIEHAGSAPSVAQTAQSYQLPLRLASELRAFEAREEDGSLAVHAALSVQLVCAQNARVIAAAPALAVATAAVPNAPEAVTAALREAARELAGQVVTWLDQVDANACLTRQPEMPRQR
jgi:cholesterol transport system auxiliary component